MAGAGFKDFTAGDILTATQVDEYLMQQAVMRFADAAARTTALSGVLAEGMLSYLDDTNAVQVYNGSSWVNVGGGSPLTTKGDVYTYSTTDARLAVGTNGQYLSANSSTSTGLEWVTPSSGSLTLIASGSLSGSTFTISSIPQTYSDIRLYLFNWSTNNNGDLVWKINNTTANTYYYIASSNNSSNYPGTSGSGIRLSSSITQSGYTSNMGCLEILNYTSTTAFKPIRGFSLNQQNGPYLESYYGGGAFADNTAVSSIVLDPESTNTFDNGTYALYGIK